MSRRVALVAGLRTPFARVSTTLADHTAIDLGAAVVRELVARSGVAATAIERVVFGQVIPSMEAPNIAREVALDAGLPRDVDASSVSRACTTSYRAVADLALAIAAGDVSCGIAGGADSVSSVPFAASRPLAAALVRQRRARSWRGKLAALGGVGLRDLVPEPPAIAERSTGLTMGEHAEQMAQENGITRAAQDEAAHRSHARAAAAWADGRMRGEVMRLGAADEDNLIRRDSQLAAYAKMTPVFDRERGTVTAGNSSPLTDGAAAVVLAAEDRLSAPPLAWLRACVFTALDPAGQLLAGPVDAIPKALERAGVRWADLDLIDLHEAFAAQLLSVTQALERRGIGTVDWDRLNVGGGSIALGHPFAATGARQLVQTANELRRRGGGLGLVAACAAGGLGAAIVLEVVL
jgi:acetyl-CoA acyltransferase